MRILIIGASIPGLCAAWWFRRAGHTVTVVEPRPTLTEGDEPVDLYGEARHIVERMDLTDGLERAARLSVRGSMCSATGVELFADDLPRAKRRLYGDRALTVSRADLVRLVLDRLRDDVSLEFGRSPLSVREDALQTFVLFDDGVGAPFDLVVGAAGRRSPTRRLILPPGAVRETDIGVDIGWVAARIDGAERVLGGAVVVQEAPGRQVVLSTLRDGRTLARFALHRSAQLAGVPVAPAAIVRAFADFGGLVPAMLEAAVQQGLRVEAATLQEIPAWHRGRVALLGDASHAPSVLAIQRTALEIRAARLLAQLVSGGGRHPSNALHRFEQDMRPHLKRAEQTARAVARWLAPPQGISAALRDLVLAESATTKGALMMRHILALTSPS
jgi:2-polyprenyl-6-methoxyphenol hydroxylase-like FAD-dependent oxidoreductase